MKFILLILVLVGSTCALQYPVEYHYLYEGHIATGIPAIRPQVAALGVKARLILQMKTKTEGIAKLNNVEVGEFNGDLECAHLRLPVPLKWSPIPQYKQQIEEPFSLSFNEEMGNVMKVPKSDVEFLTNIRKSVVEALRLEPVVANLGGLKGDRLAGFVSGGKAPDVFSLEEETLFGRCESQYTLTRLPTYLLEREKEEIEKRPKKDEQAEGSARSSGASVPKLQEQYWRLVRAVDFDKCHDRVVLQHSGIGNMSGTGYAQFKSVQSRSSVGTFILKGEPGAFRVEKAVIEGDVIINPFGFKTQKIQTITNQTLVLESAQTIQTLIRLPDTRDVKTWRYEVASPFSQPEGHPKPWVNYHSKNDRYFPVNFQYTLLGLPLTSSLTQEYKKNFLQLLEDTVREIHAEPSMPSSFPSWQSTKGSVALTYLHHMAQMMRILPHSEVEQIFSETFGRRDIVSQRKQMLLSDIAAASGAAAPIHVLLEKMKKGEISPQRTGSIFMTIPNNLYSPSVIPELVEYSKTVDIEKNPVLASAVLVNVASVVERVCLNHKKFNYSVPNPVFGREVCKPSEILSNFLPYLKEKAQKASRSWERTIFIQAIANLGSSAVLPVLRPYIYGQHDSNRNVRIIAIYGLSKKRMPDSTREVVFHTLMEIVENLREVLEIRQAAFATLLTWHPDAAWWQRMARMTWKEPHQSMAALITSTVENVAKSTEPHLHRQSRIAAFVLPLLKPFSPSIKYSYNYFYSRFNEPSKVGVHAEFAYFHSLQDAFPREIYSTIQGNVGDLHLQMFEVALASTGLTKNVSDLIYYFLSSGNEEIAHSFSIPRDVDSGNMKDIVDLMKGSLGATSFYEGKKEANVYLRAFDNMYQYIPLNSEVISKLAGEEGSHFIQKLFQGEKFNMTKFFNPVDLEYLFPSEIGLPVMGMVSMPTINVGDVEVKLFAPEMSRPTLDELLKATSVTLLFKSNYKYMSKLIVKMQMLAPWNMKMVESGIEDLREINLPIYGNLTLNHTSEIKNLTLNMAPFPQKQFPVVYAHNIPYTEIRDFIPSRNWNVDYKVIAVEKNRSPSMKVQKEVSKKYTGLSMEMTYHADTPYPFTSAFLTDYLQKPEHFVKLLASPTAKQWQLSMNIHPESSTRNISAALAYLTPARSGGSKHIPAFSSEDTVEQRLEKLRTLSEGSQVYGFNVQLFFNGTEFRKYETLLAFTRRGQSQQKKEYKAIFALMADRIPGYTQSPKALCTQAEFDTPDITDLSTLKQVIQSDPQERIHGQVYYGNNCASSQIMSYQGSAKVSPERVSRIQDEIVKICSYDPMNPFVELQTPAVYDEGQMEIQFSKEKVPESLLNTTYSIQKTLEGATYPHGYYNTMHVGQENKITLTTKRPLSSEGYTFWVELPRKYSIFTEIYVPYWMSRIVPLTGLQTSFNKYSNLMIKPVPTFSCKINRDSVTTYDGLKYGYIPLPCWTTAAIDSRKPLDFIVNTRRATSGEFEAQVLIPDENANVLITRKKAVINGEPIPASESTHVVKGSSGEVIMEVRKGAAYYEVALPRKLSVMVKDEINVMPASLMKGHLRAVCGDFDGETTYDKTGPKDCLYTDLELFKYAWTVPRGEGCDHSTVMSMSAKVAQFQQHCDHASSDSNLELQSVYESKITNCYTHVYPVRREGSLLCITEESVQNCNDCSLYSKRPKKVSAKCWPVKSAPKEMKDAEATRGYLDYPIGEEPQTKRTIKVWEVIDCRS